MNKKILLIAMIFIAQGLKAQNQFLQLTLGAGGGLVTAYTSNPAVKTNIAFNGTASYYPLSFFNIEAEGQMGKLGGETFSQSHVNFSNKYQAAIVVANLQLGCFIEKSRAPFLNFLRDVYLGAGFGMIHNRIGISSDNSYYNHSIIPLVPIKLGYEFNLISYYNDPVLKMDFSYSLNSTIGRGLYGDYGPVSQAVNSYSYYSIQLKYAIDLEKH